MTPRQVYKLSTNCYLVHLDVKQGEKQMKEQETNIDVQEEETIKDENINEEQKMFTQEEVNKIISKRLKGYKELQNKSQEVEKMSKTLACKEYLLDNNYPSELLNIINTDDVEEFKDKVEKLYKCVKPRKGTPLYNPEPVDLGHGGLTRERRKPKDPFKKW